MSDQNFATPILKGFTIKAYVESASVDSEASLRRSQESAQGSDPIDDPPYYPPTPPNPSDPNTPPSEGGGSNPGNGGGSNPGNGGTNPGGGTSPGGNPDTDIPDTDEGGTSAEGMMSIKIEERKEPDEWCYGADWPVKATITSQSHAITRVVVSLRVRPKGVTNTAEYQIKEFNYTDGSKKKTIEPVIITKEQLAEWGATYETYVQTVVKAYNEGGQEAIGTDWARLKDCSLNGDPDKDTDGDGIPDSVDPNPNEPDLLKITISPKNADPCADTDIIVMGIAEGPFPITQIALLVNGAVIDRLVFTDNAKEKSYRFTFPIIEYIIGDSFVIEVKALDSEGHEATDDLTVTIKDCSLEEPPKSRECLMFDTLHIEYFDADVQDIRRFDIPADWLPYEIDNNNGATVTFGWGDDSSIAAWFSSGSNTTGYGFQLSSIGINYLDEYNAAKSAWASSIKYKTDGVVNELKMLGDPTEKSTPWIEEIKNNGSYSHSPSIGRKNDYVKFGFPNTFMSNQCPINKTIVDPESSQEPDEDPTNPSVDPYDPSKNPVRSCLLLDKIIFQYYSDVSNDMQTTIVPLSWLVTQEITIPTKSGNAVIVVGWSDYFRGVSILIRNGVGVNNIQLTGVGVIFKDFYDKPTTAWATDINFKTAGVKNASWMKGGPKSIGDLPWTAEVAAGSYASAPVIGKTGDFIVSKHMDIFTTQVCAVDPGKNSDPETGVGPDPILNVTSPYPNPITLAQPANTPLTISGYADIYPEVFSIIVEFKGRQVYSTSSSGTHKDFTFTLSAAEVGTETGMLVITGKNKAGKTTVRIIEIAVNYVEPTPPANEDEGSIENSYDLLFRLRWGASTNGQSLDLDFHAFVDKDPNKKVSYQSPNDSQYSEYRSYVEGTSKLYLNFDYTVHLPGTDPWNNEVEIITVDGFAGRTLTLVANRYKGSIFHVDRDAQVEIVNAANGTVLKTIVLAKSLLTSALIVCDINLKNPGQTSLSDIVVRNEPRDTITPI